MAGNSSSPEQRERRKARRLARKLRGNNPAPAKTPANKEKSAELAVKNRATTSPIVEKFFRFDSSHGQPKIFCKACGKSFTWNDTGRSLGISVSFAVRHMIERHSAPTISAADLKDWILRRVKNGR